MVIATSDEGCGRGHGEAKKNLNACEFDEDQTRELLKQDVCIDRVEIVGCPPDEQLKEKDGIRTPQQG